MVYRPTGSARMRYPPVSSLDVVRTWLVPALVALIAAPPTTAPVGSCTVPRIEPVTSALSQSQVVKRISPARTVRRIFISPFVLRDGIRMSQRDVGIKPCAGGPWPSWASALLPPPTFLL